MTGGLIRREAKPRPALLRPGDSRTYPQGGWQPLAILEPLFGGVQMPVKATVAAAAQ